MTKLDWFHLFASIEIVTFCGSVLTFLISPLAEMATAGTGSKMRGISTLLFLCWLLLNAGLLTWGMVAFVWSVQ